MNASREGSGLIYHWFNNRFLGAAGLNHDDKQLHFVS